VIETLDKDVVVVGSGGAGMTAATVAARLGLDVLLVEKSPFFGGTTALSGGGIWVPCNSLEQEAGIEDSRDLAMRYIKESVGPTVREDLLEVFLQQAPKMVDFLRKHTAVEFVLQEGFPDWHPEISGFCSGGRLLTPVDYRGTELEDDFGRLRPPLSEFNAPGGMMIGLSDMPHIANVNKSWASFRYIAGLISKYAFDRLRYSRGARLTMGNALAARLLRSCLDAGVELWSEAPMSRLQTDGKSVTGVAVKRDGQEVSVKARRGVILASGGFSANSKMRQQFIPYPEHHVSLVPDSNTGDGINNALQLGGKFDGKNISNAGWVVVSVLKNSDGSIRKFPHLFLDRGKPGCIAVNGGGKRFGNEATTNLVEPMHRSGSVPAHLICDHTFIKKYGLGLVRPGGIGLRRMLKAGYVISAPTVEALANEIGANSTNLIASIERFNLQAITGVDDDYRRGAQTSDFAMGDMHHKPNPCLGPIQNAPFYAVKIYPGDSTTTVGLKVDTNARVVDQQDRPIPGLQAIGLDMNSLWRGRAPGNGANNTLGLTFGYVAARTLAADQCGSVPDTKTAAVGVKGQ